MQLCGEVGHINNKGLSVSPEIITEILQSTQYSSIASARMDAYHIYHPPSKNGINVHDKDAHDSHPGLTYHPGVRPLTYNFPCINLITNGIQQVRLRVSQSRLPITPTILCRVKAVLNQDPMDFSNIRTLVGGMLYGFLWFHEEQRTYSSEQFLYNPEQHLSMRDVAINNHCSPSPVAIAHRVSKTSQF